MALGDHLRVKLFWKNFFPYWHHGIEVAGGDVIHYCLPEQADQTDKPITSDENELAIRRTSRERFSRGKPIEVVPCGNPLPVDEVVTRAEQSIGTQGYSLLHGNCEHWASSCKSGDRRSYQVEQAENLAKSAVSTGAKISAQALAKKSAGRALLGSLHKPLLVAVTSATKVTKITLVADIAQLAASTGASYLGATPATTRRVGYVVGYSTAACIGFTTAGPPGAIAAVTFHATTDKIGDAVIDCAKNWWGPAKT